MSYVSAGFLLFLAVCAAVYFLFPIKQYQWTVLLAASWIFYLAASLSGAVYLAFTTLTTWAGARLIGRMLAASEAAIAENRSVWDRGRRRAFTRTEERKRRRVLAVVLALNFGALAIFKYYGLAATGLAPLLGLAAPTRSLVMPVGISFYTFQATGYIIDVAHGTVRAERNLARYSLFVSFFPQIIEGPIGVYGELAPQLCAPHSFDFTRLKHGCELMLWGFFKKLVIADRAAVAMGALFENPDLVTLYNGTTITFGLFICLLQLYADFSGGIDISRGAAQIFGIDLPENFRQPYFAVSLSDYWRRWHITLGAWMRSYLFYPVAMSKPMQRLTGAVRKSRLGRTKAGPHIARALPSCVGMTVVFLVVGAWHGAAMKYLLYGLYNGVLISLSILLAPVFAWQNRKLRLNEDGILLRLFRMARTLVLLLIATVTDLAVNCRSIPGICRAIVTGQDFREAYYQIRDYLGLLEVDYIILACGVLVMLAVSIVRERHPDRSLRLMLDDGPYLLRGGLCFFCLAAVLVFGMYGWVYTGTSFVYMQF